MAEKIRIILPIYEGVTQLDFTGPHQFFTRMPGTEVLVASVGGEPVEASGLVFTQLADLSSIETCDVLCVPGGAGCVNVLENEAFLRSIRRLAQVARYVTSVCTGSIILGAAGLLEGKRAACHWAWRDMLPAFGAIPDAGRVVRDGNLITAGGVTSGIDFALTMIAELAGVEVAESVQLSLEYAPEPPFASGRPELARPEVLKAVTERLSKQMSYNRMLVERAAAKLSGLSVST